MREHVSLVFPKEACGLLAGIANRVLSIFPVKNIENDNHRYRMDPLEQLTCFLTIEKQNQELLGIYHSHPQGPAYPSAIDIAEAYYPDTPYLIWALNERQWSCQAFLLKNQNVIPVNLEIEDEPS